MNEIEKIKLSVLEDLLNEIQSMHPEYIEEHIEEKIKIIKYGI